ncbi:hypothetical protein GCM10007862_11610 [Dyella lipolytica]|uniref:Heparinase II/III-like protein n=1 Tax=Dyella lipolytica TaxID=1867835 RepID=A0ABW8IXK7_9GAMM|nr:hypothetical protein [Dyella lipolytica]GLQ46110.1 hypothetical protein GCM10007862_11610 [Dyella lipolytica]
MHNSTHAGRFHLLRINNRIALALFALIATAAYATALQQPAAPAQPTAPALHLAAHPRLLLDAATLALLRQNAAAKTPAWRELRNSCDTYLGGTVNDPHGDAYPNHPNLGAGYQGDTYFSALLDEGMCYQVLKASNSKAAAEYGAKAVDILMKMSTPFAHAAGNRGWNPCTDDGYGIRFYGVGFGLGYDWVYELLTPDQRHQVYTTANAWLNAWETPSPFGCANFEYRHPQSNYFAGYFHAKAVIALATYDENPVAPAQWTDWLQDQFDRRVLPYYTAHLSGGGWPEGFGSYATLGILNMSLPAREVKTATGIDLVHAATPYSFPLDSADYLMHFTWPSRAYVDDRDTNHATGSPPPPGTAQTGLAVQILGELNYWHSPTVGGFHTYLNDIRKATTDFQAADAWLTFLDNDPRAPTVPLDTLPLSYLAPGMGAVAARSDWTTHASWMSLRAGPYINNPGQGEEGFDQGGLALVRGATPLLVNASGWLVHEPKGSADEDRAYADLFADFNGTLYRGNRQLYNIYYVRNMHDSSVLDRFGQAAYTREDDKVRTGIASYEDGSDYVYVLATHLEDMYRAFRHGPGVAAWSREIVYLRPNRFVVYDRTRKGAPSFDQYLAFHFPANLLAVATTGSGKRLDVSDNGEYVGAMLLVLPQSAATTTVPLYPDDKLTKVWQVQVRPADAAIEQRWLTVFDLSPTATAVAAASPVAITQGAAIGVRLAADDGNSVVISSQLEPGAPIAGTIAYDIPATAAHHVIVELAPDRHYAINVSKRGELQHISVSPDGPYTASNKGVLDFDVSASGTVCQRSVSSHSHCI